MPYKKLIETVMPVSVINLEAEREKNARNGLPSSVHIWWSRRPMAAARSTLFASLVDDPSSHPELFPTVEDQNKERQRLLQITEDLAVVENASNELLLDSAREEIFRYTNGNLPIVFDPFSGSGTIPIEAHRLGLGTEASDLNAVASIITSIVSDVPNRFNNTFSVHPKEEITFDIPLSVTQALAKDIRWYGNWVNIEAYNRIGRLYPKTKNPESGKELEVSAWIWTRTVRCPNPSCDCQIPLSSSYDLAKRKGAEAWVEPIVENGKVHFQINTGVNPIIKEKPKVGQSAVFRCPSCGEITTDAYVKECGISNKISNQLIAVVVDADKKRLYIEPDSKQIAAADIISPKNVPSGKLPNYPHRFTPPSFGLTDYADLFTNRQLVYLTTMMELCSDVQTIIEKDAMENGFVDDGIPFVEGGKGALAYAQAIRTVLVLTLSKLSERCSNLCSWNPSEGGALRNVFFRAGIPMIWDFVEANPFGSSSGSFLGTLDRICETIASLPTGTNSHTTVADCTQANSVRNAMVSTDLPYYDRVSYADLSDFFYVWLKYGLGELFPKWFSGDVSPKKEELTAFAYRWNGDRYHANAYYEEGLNLVFSNLYESVGDEFPSTTTFFYKGYNLSKQDALSEWETFVTALCNAGFMITASWPLARKYENNIHLAESKGIPVTVVFRKRPENALQTTRRSFVSAVKRELPNIVDTLRQHVEIMDLRSSIIGQALMIYSKYDRVLDADGSIMKPATASRIIEQELDTLLVPIYDESIKNDDSKEEVVNGRES